MKKTSKTDEKLGKASKLLQKKVQKTDRKNYESQHEKNIYFSPRLKFLRYINWSVVILCCVLSLAYCTQNTVTDKKEKPPVPVLVTKIRQGDIPLYLRTIGTVTALESVNVRTQINGRILKVNFKEGEVVKKGQVLVEIDPSPYEALLKQYEGQLARDKALLRNAKIDLTRYKKLYAQDSVSQQTLETQTHLVKQYEGVVASDLGLIEAAKVNLNYCNIVSDITGMIGLRQVNPGNFVQTSDTNFISTINQISPITVVFPIPEDDLSKVQEKLKNHDTLDVDVFDRKDETLIAKGKFLAMDSQIDNTTGTIKLKAIFENDEYRLFPNQFVNVRLSLGALSRALIIPDTAIQMGREGTFIYVVNDEQKTVSVKPIAVKVSENGLACVVGDVTENQTVVMQGIDKLYEGASILAQFAEIPLKESQIKGPDFKEKQ